MDQKGTQMSKSPILQAVGLTKSYGRVVALDGSDPVSYTHLTLPTILLV